MNSWGLYPIAFSIRKFNCLIDNLILTYLFSMELEPGKQELVFHEEDVEQLEQPNQEEGVKMFMETKESADHKPKAHELNLEE